MPAGGINPTNVKEYLAISSVLACGGTWMVPSDLIDNEQWDELAQLIAEVTNVIK